MSACEGSHWPMALSLYTAGHSTYEPLSAQPVGAPRDAELRNVLLAVMRWDRALCLVEEMKEGQLELKVVSFSALMKACQRAERSELALKLFASLASVQLDVISFNTSISACQQGGRWQQALSFLGSMAPAELKPGVTTFGATMTACEKAGQWPQALNLLRAMVCALIQSNLMTCSALISACEKGRRWQHALILLETMIEKGYLMDVLTFNAAISACEKSGQWCCALGLLDQMLESQLQANDISFNAIISACEKGSQWQRAISLLDMIPLASAQADVISFTSALSSFAVYRPTSRDAIAKMLSGAAVGKGLNVKGKSAKLNRLSGFVPFLQISQEILGRNGDPTPLSQAVGGWSDPRNDKAEVAPSPSDACVTIYFASDELRSRELHLKTAARELFGELGT
eukprot:g22969.t1